MLLTVSTCCLKHALQFITSLRLGLIQHVYVATGAYGLACTVPCPNVRLGDSGYSHSWMTVNSLQATLLHKKPHVSGLSLIVLLT